MVEEAVVEEAGELAEAVAAVDACVSYAVAGLGPGLQASSSACQLGPVVCD
jgi:hypothetical protein